MTLNEARDKLCELAPKNWHISVDCECVRDQLGRSQTKFRICMIQDATRIRFFHIDGRLTTALAQAVCFLSNLPQPLTADEPATASEEEEVRDLDKQGLDDVVAMDTEGGNA